MHNKFKSRLSMFIWKSLTNLTFLTILSLICSAAVRAETCPKVNVIKFAPEQGRYISDVVDGISWNVEFRRPQNVDQGVPVCHYSTDPRHTPRVFIAMTPIDNVSGATFV